MPTSTRAARPAEEAPTVEAPAKAPETYEPAASGATLVRWEQAFESPKVEAGLADIVVPANEQNLDRLTAEVLHPAGGGGPG